VEAVTPFQQSKGDTFLMANPMTNLNPHDLYEQMSQEQRAAVAREYMQGFQQSNHPMAQQFTQLDPNTVTPRQLAAMHQHAAQEHPGIFGKVMRHPILTAALAGFGIYEVEKHLGH
jgi:hypothetical protein